MNTKDKIEELESLIAELREVFLFPPDRDYNNGYDITKKDGWCLSNIIASPKICLEMMIAVSDKLQSHPIPKISEKEIDEMDRKEFNTIVEYLEGKYTDLGKKKRNKITDDSPKQLLQMINTIKRMLALTKRAKPKLTKCDTCKYNPFGDTGEL